MDQDLLIRNGFVSVPAVSAGQTVDAVLYSSINVSVATIVANLAAYGYTVDRGAFAALLASDELAGWWESLEPVLKIVTGADRNMGDHIVFKNFPREVLEMDIASSIFRQILIYWGVPYDAVREPEQARPPLGDIARLKVLALADDLTPFTIYQNLVVMRNRWSDNQIVWATALCGDRNAITCSDFGFKENAIRLAATHFETMEFVASSATDVLRLAAALSSADVSLREKVRFRHFKRAERKRLLTALDAIAVATIKEDMASRPGPWKRLMEHLRPGDYRNDPAPYVNVQTAYDGLYKRTVKSFAALVDPQKPSLATLDKVATRPGEFLRRFHRFYGLFGTDAVARLETVLDKLSTRQLASFRGYLRTINTRKSLIYAPKGNWGRARVVPNEKAKIAPNDRRRLDIQITKILTKRLAAAYPEGIALDMRVDQVRLQANDQKLAEYGHGTEFDIPDSITFLRSASFWESGRPGVTWFDNGWNFFNENWAQQGACSWNDQHSSGGHKAAVFSGDPVNISDHKGRACQMIDLYLDRLAKQGIRYAVWNILCYSKVKFSEVTEVLATLQMGDDAETGKTYEPARAQMVFPIKSATLSNYIAYVDIKRRKLIYMDVGFPANVQYAGANCEKLATMMPAYVEYLEAQPTLLEIMQDAPSGKTPVQYDDLNMEITSGRAFVFRPENSKNKFERLSLTDLVNV